MLSEICAEIKNYFSYEEDRHVGDWTINDGVIAPSFDFKNVNYIRIVGSRLNDGVYKVSELATKLHNETFHGAIWLMSPPADFLSLVEEIESWQDANGKADSANMSPFQSESFGGYSYSKGSTNSNSQAGVSSVPTWQSQYASRLKIYRRIRTL